MTDQKDKNYDKEYHDRSLIAMFLKMSIEERIAANDNAVNMILEMRGSLKGNVLNQLSQKGK